MTVEEKAKFIIRDVKLQSGTDPCVMFRNIVKNEYMNMHGPEHHVLDGACLLMAFYNAGGKIDIDEALGKIFTEGLRMPGGMCGLWGICGAISSLGAALSIIDNTALLSTDGSWGNRMQFTASAACKLGKINGPRCCKRDAMVSLKNAIEYVNKNYNVELSYSSVKCNFSSINQQCIKERCPFFK